MSLSGSNGDFVSKVSKLTGGSLDSGAVLGLLGALDEHLMVAVADALGSITYVNQPFCAISQYSEGELLGETHRVLKSDYHPNHFWELVWATISTGVTWKGEVCNRAKDGSHFWLQMTIRPVVGKVGEVEQYIALGSDVSEQKLLEMQLRNSQEAMLETSRVAKIGSWDLDLKSMKPRWSWMTKVIHEVPDDFEPDVEVALEFFPMGHNRDRIQELVGRAIEFLEPYDEELQIRLKSGALKWVRAICQPDVKDGKCVRLHGVFQDIDAEHKMREAGEISESLLRNLLDAATEFALIATDVDGQIVLFNSGAEKLLGYEASELVGKKTPIVFHLESEVEKRAIELSEELGRQVEGFEAFVVKAMQDGSEQRDWTYVRKDGARVPVTLVATPVRNPAGDVTGFLGVARDLSEQRRAENDLRESESRFRRSFEFSGIGMAIVSLDGRWLQVNQSLIDMLGYDRAVMMEKTFQEITYPEDLDTDLGFLQEALEGKRQNYVMEKRYFDANGDIVWVRLNVSLVRDANGDPVHFISQLENITEGKVQTRKLREVSERLNLAVRAGGIGIWDFEIGTGKLIWDEQMFALHGADPERFAGDYSDWKRFLHPEDFDDAVAAVQAAIAGEREFNTEFRIVRSDGEVRHLRALSLVQRAEDGTPLRLVGTNWDVSDIVAQKEELLALAERAEEASKAKSQFLANMSHEIRTPINGVIGMTALLLDSPGLSAEQVNFAKVIQSSGESLLALINDILDFSKVEAGRLELEILEFDLRSSLEDVVSIMSQRARDKGLKFSCSPDEDVPNRLLGDPGRLRQILLNLLANAIKFTDEGSVEIGVGLERFEGEEAVLRFSVTDTGIGISPEKAKALFQEFSQADPSMTRLYGGTGLGLAISKQLATLMDGEIGLNSREGEGSEFWFTVRLPYREGGYVSESTDQRAEMDESKFQEMAKGHFERRAARILVAEDNVVNQMVVRGILSKFGLHADIVANGLEALEALGRISYDLVLMDVQMPELDGLEASRRIRAGVAGEGTKEVPIIALTAHARMEDKIACFEAGMNEYLSKPIDPKMLFKFLDRMLPIAQIEERSSSNDVTAFDVRVFDRTQFVSGMMDDVDLANEIAEASLVDLAKYRVRLEEIFSSSSEVELHRSVHSIKGISAHLCCSNLLMYSSKLEEEIRAGNVEGVRENPEGLAELLDEAMASLQRFLGE